MKLNVATFNIQHAQNYPHYLKTKQEIIDFDLVSEQIKAMGADVCVLNEVRNETNVSGVDQSYEIASRLGFYHYFAKAINIRSGGEYGNAIVSRYPITKTELYPIALPEECRGNSPRYESRVLLRATVDVLGQEVTVLGCHFGLSDPEKERALEVVLSVLKEINTPVVFAGDFNITPEHPIIKKLSGVLYDTAEKLESVTATFIGTVGADESYNKKIDYIFSRGMEPISAKIVEESCSDHRSMYAIFEL